jgi:DNA gyrase subunit B
LPDKSIFKKQEFNYETLASRLRELSFLNAGLKIILIDARGKEQVSTEFYNKGGLEAFVKYLNENKNVMFPKPVYFHKERDSVDVELSLQYTDGYSENIFSYVNNINTIEGGSHLVGFKTALTRTINNYATKNNLFKNGDTQIQGEDAREGLTAVLSVKVVDPQFEGKPRPSWAIPKSKGLSNR